MGQEIALPALHQSVFVVSDKEPRPGLLLGQHRRPQEAVSSGLIGSQSKFFSNGQGTLKLSTGRLLQLYYLFPFPLRRRFSTSPTSSPAGRKPSQKSSIEDAPSARTGPGCVALLPTVKILMEDMIAHRELFLRASAVEEWKVQQNAQYGDRSRSTESTIPVRSSAL